MQRLILNSLALGCYLLVHVQDEEVYASGSPSFFLFKNYFRVTDIDLVLLQTILACLDAKKSVYA